jgi:hypothetical protein
MTNPRIASRRQFLALAQSALLAASLSAVPLAEGEETFSTGQFP